MNALGFIAASLRHYRRVHIAVALGVAVATAVLTGALLVGDSVSGSLHNLTLQRLGRIDSALVAGHMFREALADELAADATFQQHFAAAEPAILATGTLQSGSGRKMRRATAISVIGCRPSFWSLGQGGPTELLPEGEVALTQLLAQELGVEAGGDVLLRLGIPASIPADSPLGEKSETSLARRLKVAAVLPPDGLARFALAPSQNLPRNIFVPIATLQGLLEQPGKCNAILVATDNPQRAARTQEQGALEQALRPTLEDYGLRVEKLPSSKGFQISADRLVLPDEAVLAAVRAFGGKESQGIVTYLANTLAAGEGGSQRKIPYSTITGVNSTAELGPLFDEAGKPIVLADDEIVLNRWAADDLQAEIGDLITVTFYEPESTHGRLREHQPPPEFRLRAIVDLETADGRPTPAADPKLTPELPGVTDQESINDWELPFELVEKIRQRDEDYWDEYRTTPKAFISLDAAQRLWSSRWGTISLVRVPEGAAGSPVGKAADRLAKAIDPAVLGMTFPPVKQQGLDSASGTTPFGWLFLGFSFFLIASSLMLIALLFQLGIQQRARELGTLAAVGTNRKRIAGLLGCEGVVVAAIGSTLGVVLGVGYAWLIITGLRTWWLAAISTPFLRLHVTPASLVLGCVVGVVISWLTILWSIRRLLHQSVVRLLGGSIDGEASRLHGGRQLGRWPVVRFALLLLTVALVGLGFLLQDEAQAGVFFSTGAFVLALLLGEVRHQLHGAGRTKTRQRPFSLSKLSVLNTARNSGRSTLTIGLVASASFLIAALSAFRLETGDAGTGGFDLIATSDQPIHYDLNTSDGRRELGFGDDESAKLASWQVFSLRMQTGEDASCLNLYRPSQPTILGVSEELMERGGFVWGATLTAARNNEYFNNPWTLLDVALPLDDNGRRIIPVVIDANTATYSLKVGVGEHLKISDSADRERQLLVVGLLKNSVLQGKLLMSEENFLRLFPDAGGYRYFLMERREQTDGEAPGGPQLGTRRDSAGALGYRDIAQLLESTLADSGFDAVDARDQLAAFLAVQNTYLSTFQSLGALGLLLGTVGLAVVQLRSVLERRTELALMRAGGFPPSRLIGMVVWENAVLLLGGLAVGCIAAAVALVPQWAPQQASIPWAALAAMLGTIAMVGLAAGWLATRSALRAPILPALRGD